MERLTNTEVLEQKERFENLLKKSNLSKAGKIIVRKIGNYEHYMFVRKYLAKSNVKGSMYHPESMKFYSELFTISAINSYVESLKK